MGRGEMVLERGVTRGVWLRGAGRVLVRGSDRMRLWEIIIKHKVNRDEDKDNRLKDNRLKVNSNNRVNSSLPIRRIQTLININIKNEG